MSEMSRNFIATQNKTAHGKQNPERALFRAKRNQKNESPRDEEGLNVCECI